MSAEVGHVGRWPVWPRQRSEQHSQEAEAHGQRTQSGVTQFSLSIIADLEATLHNHLRELELARQT